ncbi:MAG: hypothetical protein A2Z29_00460 [Chloroflexi bacterium RBG_16_56_11]|nr:MAG: hypothetical protein A2Z29_00460 [Chloroflexi bacterium RBG_16_56_11]
MADKSDISTLKAWLVVLVSLLDEAAVLALIFLGLWVFHVRITWTVVLVVALMVIGFAFIVHKALIPSLRRKKMTGAEGMLGLVGRVTEPLQPEGTIKVGNEYWKAKSVEGNIGAGEEVEVIAIKGLSLDVRRKTT